MSDLPTGWIETTIGDITIGVEQRVPSPDDEFFYIDISSINRDTKQIITPQKLTGSIAPSRARQHVRRGDTLVSMTRPNLNAVAIVPKDFDGQIASTGFNVLRANNIDPRWLYFLVRTDAFVSAMSSLVQGALYPAIRPRDIGNYSIPLAPLPEQKRIANKLDRLLAQVDACQAHLERVPEILKRFRRSVLAAAVSGRLTEEWRENETEVETNVSTFPTSWSTTTFGDVLTLIDGDRGPNYPKQSDYLSNGHCLFLSTKNVRWFGFEFNDLVFISEEKHNKLRAGTLQRGDVIITTRGTLGNVAHYDEKVPFDIIRINSGMLILQSKSTDLLGKFLMICIASPFFKAQLDEKRSGSAQPQIPATTLKTFILPIPPIEEQHEIVHRVERLFTFADQFEARWLSAQGRVRTLTPSLLAKAFCGELVPQDPDDEPAEKLLERIRMQRVTQAVEKPRRQPQTKKTRETKMTEETVKKIIAQFPENKFSFEELREKLPGDYEQLKSILFTLLAEPDAVITQVFDPSVKAIRFVRMMS